MTDVQQATVYKLSDGAPVSIVSSAAGVSANVNGTEIQEVAFEDEIGFLWTWDRRQSGIRLGGDGTGILVVDKEIVAKLKCVFTPEN
jgi:hypothetical protein